MEEQDTEQVAPYSWTRDVLNPRHGRSGIKETVIPPIYPTILSSEHIGFAVDAANRMQN